MRNKNKQISVPVMAFFALSMAFVTPSFGQAQIAGGYNQISKTDETVVAAANFAVKTQEARKTALVKLVSVIGAKRQIVAGSNYQLCLVVNSANKRQEAVAVVYQNLQNEFKLTSWTPGKCSAAYSGNSKQSTKLSASANAATAAPDRIVKNLYTAQKGGTGPFFQHKSRRAVDRFFTRSLADLIWKDTEVAKGEVGTIDFDPLYNAQDEQITAFKIGEPEYGEGNTEVADVPVTFKNMGKAETVLFRLERSAEKTWKISDIYYPANPEYAPSLKKILSQ